MNLPDNLSCTIAVIGLGYVGLPLAIEISKNQRCFKTKKKITRKVIGYDLSIKRISELKATREELTVHDFMRPKMSLMSFDFTELTHSSVGDVIETLKDYGQHHCLVMDRDTHEVRGVISVSDIARELRLPLDIQGRPTFAELITILAA